MAKTMSERQFAKLVGAALSSVQDRRKSGGLALSVTRARGRYRIDPAIGREEWEASTPLRVAVKGDEETLRAWREARARRETALAAKAEDELRVSRGELVEVAGLDAKLVGEYTRARNKLLGVPSRARQRDPTLTLEHLTLVGDLIREALEDLADGKEASDGNE